MNRLIYYIAEALRSLREAKMVTAVSIITVAVTMFLLTALVLVLYNLNDWVSRRDAAPVLSVYFHPDITDSRARAIADSLSRADASLDIQHSTRQEEYDRFIDLWGKEFLAETEDNPFPPALYIHSPGTRNMEDFALKLRNHAQIESAIYAQEWSRSLQQIRTRLNGFMAAAFAVILAALFFTITNTVKLTIYARRDLVRNMQYMGAGFWYIRWPFIIEGLFQGVLGALAAWGAIFILREFIITAEGITWFTGHLPAGMVSAGLIMGVFGSFSAIRRFE
ncbi:MAG: cell division protein FtsX [Fibrobacterota bacterium]